MTNMEATDLAAALLLSLLAIAVLLIIVIAKLEVMHDEIVGMLRQVIRRPR
jgi:hypothetical protein